MGLLEEALLEVYPIADPGRDLEIRGDEGLIFIEGGLLKSVMLRRVEFKLLPLYPNEDRDLTVGF